MRRDVVCAVGWLLVFLCGHVAAQDPAATTGAQRITDKLQADAKKLEPLVQSALAKEFLLATKKLLEPEPRVVYRNAEQTNTISQKAFAALSADEQVEWTPRECPPAFYYETGYGSPLVYSRVLDIVAPHWDATQPRKLLDFGYGSIGQLQLLGHLGFEAHGVDVEPMFAALYSEAGDTGPFGQGSVKVHTGQWPADSDLQSAVGAGYTLITSKNTLKAGYIHPTPPAGQTVDPNRLVHLGVSDEDFLQRVRSALVPGGVFIIYNICPPQNSADKPYLPHADGKSPFSREDFEQAGFEVLAFDVEDQAWVLDGFAALGYTKGRTPEQSAQDYFCWYTIVRRVAKLDTSATPDL